MFNTVYGNSLHSVFCFPNISFGGTDMNSRRISEHEYLTINDVQRHLNISQSSTYELVHRKDFPMCRFGGHIRIPQEAFLAWVDSKTYIPEEISRQMVSA